MDIERFQACHADAVSNLIRRNLHEINSKDYPPEFITFLVDHFSPAQILENAQTQHIFVAVEAGKVIGTGGLANFGTVEAPRFYGVVIFVAPERQGQGIGKQLMAAVESQAAAMGAETITVRSAISARGFYEKLGYQFQDGQETRDERGNYILEKVLSSQAF